MGGWEWDAVVIGAGAAGLVAAAHAAERGRRVLLLEKGRKPGVKILMSGGTRCNITHDCDAAASSRRSGRCFLRLAGKPNRERGRLRRPRCSGHDAGCYRREVRPFLMDSPRLLWPR